MSNGKTIGGIIMIVFGSILMILGLLFAAIFLAIGSAASDEELMDAEIQKQMDSFLDNALEAPGEITDINWDEDITTIGYQSALDDAYYELHLNTILDDYTVGDAIDVYYNIDDPSNAIVLEAYDVVADMVGGLFIVIGAVALGVGVLGLILLIVGIVLVVKGKKNNPRNDIPAGNYQNGPY